MYYHDADAVLLVFDVTNRESLHAVENYWCRALKQNLLKLMYQLCWLVIRFVNEINMHSLLDSIKYTAS